jgi:hypothetical protein
MCRVCCKCEWLGAVEVPYYTCCGHLCRSVEPTCTYMAFCREPNENKCRNSIICAIPCLFSTFLALPIMGACELCLITTCDCCGSASGQCCEWFHKVDSVRTVGFPSMDEVEHIYKNSY